jgi:putative oxidoreductase
MKRFFFFNIFKPDRAINLASLLLRLAAASMLVHGWAKLANFSEKAEKFSDPLNIGHTGSLALTVFAEFFCTIFIVLGIFTRAASIPLMITMAVVVFMVHAHDPFGDKELAVLYLFLYAAIFVIGPGKYSIDRQLLKAP